MLYLGLALIWWNFIVVINAQLERKQKLVSNLLIEKQRLEVMKRNVVTMENDIARRRSYPKRVCILQAILIKYKYYQIIFIYIFYLG